MTRISLFCVLIFIGLAHAAEADRRVISNRVTGTVAIDITPAGPDVIMAEQQTEPAPLLPEEERCSICRDERRATNFTLHNAGTAGAPILHKFHRNCLLQWIMNNGECCPMCRGAREEIKRIRNEAITLQQNILAHARQINPNFRCFAYTAMLIVAAAMAIRGEW